MIEDENNKIDSDFKEGLNNFNPLPRGYVWDRIKESLSVESRYHEIDDKFHESVTDYSESAPKQTWENIKKGLEQESTYGFEKLSNQSFNPPEWVWTSLKHYNFVNSKRNKYKKSAIYTLLFLLIPSIILFVLDLQKNINPELSKKYIYFNNNIPTDKPIYNTKKTIGPNTNKSKTLFSLVNLSQSPVLINTDKYINYVKNDEIEKIYIYPKQFNLKPFEFLRNNVLFKTLNRPKKKRKNHFSIKLSGSKNISYRSLKGNENESYLNIRNNSEFSLKTYSFSALINYNIKKIKLSTGLQYTQRGEKAKYDFKTTSETQTNVVFYNQTTSSLFAVPYKYKLTYDHQKNSENIYEYLEIPIKASYKLNKNKLSFSPSISINTGILLKATGTTVTTSNVLGKLELNSLNYSGINRYNFSIGTSVEISYSITPKTSIFIEPFYNNSLSNSLKDIANIKQKFSNKGIGIGVEINL